MLPINPGKKRGESEPSLKNVLISQIHMHKMRFLKYITGSLTLSPSSA